MRLKLQPNWLKILYRYINNKNDNTRNTYCLLSCSNVTIPIKEVLTIVVTPEQIAYMVKVI